MHVGSKSQDGENARYNLSADAYRQRRRGYRSVTSMRRFPPPWSVQENGGQKLAYAYCEEEPSRLSPTQRRSCISSGRGDHRIGRPWLVARPIRMAS
jgi:hypothetical protein